MALPPRNLPHIRIQGGGQAENYSRPRQKIEPRPIPARDRGRHAAALRTALDQAIEAGREQIRQRAPQIAEGTPRFYLEMQIAPGEKDVIANLGNQTRKIEVVSVKISNNNEDPIQATLFVPEHASEHFSAKVDAYRDDNTSSDRPKNESLVARLDTARIATVQSLFTDPEYFFPQNEQSVWWEIWLRHGTRERFTRVIERLGIRHQGHSISFPEREVILVHANEASLSRAIINCDAVAELKLAKDTPALFRDLNAVEAAEWTTELLARIEIGEDISTSVCLLDTGVNRIHPLINPALDNADRHTIEPAWGPEDTHGHGTQMAGIALYGDLTPHLISHENIVVNHKLESVKILPPQGQNDPKMYGYITQEAIARAEAQAPRLNRAICMAVTSDHLSIDGQPSSWSAAVDQICCDPDGYKLVILSAGNIHDDIIPDQYPTQNDNSSIEDPSQSWNALTIGAFTEKTNIIDNGLAGWQPIAPIGDLCPSSLTSVYWGRQWPIKPDIVLEGGNYATDGIASAEPINDLQLLTTHHRPSVHHFDMIGDTSAATAQAGRMAAQIMSARPEFWPETVRALMVHSAEWTPAMRNHLAGTNKTQQQFLMRRYGYGVPDLERALLSAENDLTLIVEDEVAPFQLNGQSIQMGEMNLHMLPWPKAELMDLENTPVSFRVTLSYFIEPNPGQRGWIRKHRYQSHGLRFEVKRASESLADFRKRINDAAREEEDGRRYTRPDDGWEIGKTNRELGSIHSDWWTGTAIDLADREAIGIFPVGGWWKEKKHLERWGNLARYSLIVTIKAPSAEVDIYTPVSNQIGIPIQV